MAEIMSKKNLHRWKKKKKKLERHSNNVRIGPSTMGDTLYMEGNIK